MAKIVVSGDSIAWFDCVQRGLYYAANLLSKGELKSVHPQVVTKTNDGRTFHPVSAYYNRPCACVGVVHIFPHTYRHFVGQKNSSNVCVDPLLAPYHWLSALLTAG